MFGAGGLVPNLRTEEPAMSTVDGILFEAEDDRSHGDEALAEAANQVRGELIAKRFPMNRRLSDSEIGQLMDTLDARKAKIRAEMDARDEREQ